MEKESELLGPNNLTETGTGLSTNALWILLVIM
jgi:hypothetical protein